MIFYQGGPNEHGTNVTVPTAQSSSESDHDAACTEGTAVTYFRMLIDELLNKNT